MTCGKDLKELSPLFFRVLLLFPQVKIYIIFFATSIQNPTSTRGNSLRCFIAGGVQCCPTFLPPRPPHILKRGRVSFKSCAAALTCCSLQSCVLASLSPWHLGKMLFFWKALQYNFSRGMKGARRLMRNPSDSAIYCGKIFHFM